MVFYRVLCGMPKHRAVGHPEKWGSEKETHAHIKRFQHKTEAGQGFSAKYLFT